MNNQQLNAESTFIEGGSHPKSGVLALSGYGIRVSVERGHLCVEDGAGIDRRRARFSRVTPGLKRLVVLGHAGVVSLEALRWLHDIGAAFVHIDVDGEVLAASGPVGLDNARLRRAQALAAGNGVGLAIAQDLVAQKLAGQAEVLSRLPNIDDALYVIRGCCEDARGARNIDELRRIEALGALTYWGEWRTLPVQFASPDAGRVPQHWRVFGTRASALSSPSPRRATNPANAILNYLYAILEAEARIAALAVGLDPGMGVMHADLQARDSLACDLMEAARPRADAFVLEQLLTRTFRKSDFFETREGICRIMPPLSHTLAETAGLWARALGPVTERVAKTLFASMRRQGNSTAGRQAPNLSTPLTESNRSAGRSAYREKCKRAAIAKGEQSRLNQVEELKAWLFS